MPKSRAWFFPTSPRSPYVFQEELALLKQLDGKPYGKELQLEFAKILAAHRGQDVSVFKDVGLSARDRITRVPKLLGCIHLPERGKKGNLVFTDAGNAMLEADDPTFLYQRQVAKVQFSSPLHNDSKFRDMRIRPMLAIAAILQGVESLNKEEIALFGVTTTDYHNIPDAIHSIKAFRQAVLDQPAGKPRKEFRRRFALSHMEDVYADDIAAGDIKIREGVRPREKALALSVFKMVKRGLHIDYADATMRYLQATGLFTVEPMTQRLRISSANKQDLQFLMDNLGPSPLDFSRMTYDEYVYDYLGNPNVPAIRKDDPVEQARDVKQWTQTIATIDKVEAGAWATEYQAAPDANSRLKIIQKLSHRVTEVKIKAETQEISKQGLESLNEIKGMYDAIAATSYSEIIDRPLMYEWNTWRAMVLMNDAMEVRGNFVVDADANPVKTASGKKADMVVEYQSFWLLVEVTLQSGHKQYEAEGESIVRHIGMFQKERIEAGDYRPVYGLFIAEKINDTVISYLVNQARFINQFYKGKVCIVPMPRTVFVKMIEEAVSDPSFNSQTLRQYFDNMFTQERLATGELDWYLAALKQAKNIANMAI